MYQGDKYGAAPENCLMEGDEAQKPEINRTNGSFLLWSALALSTCSVHVTCTRCMLASNRFRAHFPSLGPVLGILSQC